MRQSVAHRERIIKGGFTRRRTAEKVDQSQEIFERYDRLVEITVLGEKKLVPENNSILRCLQYLDMDKISEAELCWNGNCIDCQVWVKNGDKEKALMSCRTNAVEGMEIVRVAEGLK